MPTTAISRHGPRTNRRVFTGSREWQTRGCSTRRSGRAGPRGRRSARIRDNTGEIETRHRDAPRDPAAQLLFLQALIVFDFGEIRRLHDVERSVRANSAALEPDRAVAEARQHRMVVTRGDDDAAALDERARSLLEVPTELVIERFVHLVQDEDVGIELLGDGESQARAHPL